MSGRSGPAGRSRCRPSGGVRLLGGRDVDLEIAAGQWARWWRHALEVGTSAIDDLRPPAFPALSGVPDLRALMQRHYYNASLWSDGLNDDPRVKRAHRARASASTPWSQRTAGDPRPPAAAVQSSGSPSSACRPNTPGCWRPTTCC